MLREVIYELIKIKSQKKNYIAIAGHLVLISLCIYGMQMSDRFYARRGIARFGISIEDFKDFLDGMFFARMLLLPTFIIILPILICTVGGDLIAGEIQDGSMKLYASRPRSRTEIIISKVIAMYIFSLGYCIYFSLMSLIVGIVFYGVPGPSQLLPIFDITNLGNDIVILPTSVAMIRYFLCVTYYSFSIMALGSITIFFSVIFNRMTSATVAGITLYFVSYILERLPILADIKPYMLSHVMNGAILFWLNVIPTGRVVENLSILAIYIVLFSGLALIIFKTKDIT